MYLYCMKKNNPGSSDPLRRKAETRLKNAQKKAPDLSDPEEIMKLLQELQVHQIELELQNDELQQALQALEDSNIRYFELYNLAPVGYCTLSEKGVILEANLTAAGILGVTLKTLAGRSFTSFILPEDQDIFYHHRKLLFESGEPQLCELRLLKKPSGYLWARLEAGVAKDPSGLPVCRVVLSDITRFKEAEEEIHQKNEQLQEINRQKDKFFSIISHDLRSPFNSLLGFTQLLAEELQDMSQDEIQRIANALQRSAINLYNLIGNLLEWSRMQRGVVEFNPEEIPLIDLVNHSLETLTDLAKQKNLEIRVLVPGDLMVKVDVAMIESTLRNLISNALKFSSRGGQIQISALMSQPGFIKLVVTDTGIGIRPEFLANLFHLTEHPSSQGTEGEPGTGLGLLLCKEFVEKHGGTIRAESEEGVGSTFTITIPV